jgi:hypothetical protein
MNLLIWDFIQPLGWVEVHLVPNIFNKKYHHLKHECHFNICFNKLNIIM